MALPTKTNLLTLDYTYLGEPFCNVPAKSSIDLSSADYVYQGEPFVSNPDTSGGSVNVTLSPVTISATIPTPTVTGDSNITLTPLSTSVTILDVVVTTNLRFWIGGTGNWTDTTHWAVSSGGTSGADVPTSSDDVFIDSNSGFGGGGTISLDGVYGSAVCHDFSSTSGHTYSIAYSSSDFSIYGSAILESGLTFGTSTWIYFLSSGSETITTNGGTLDYSLFGYDDDAYYSGGTWTLQDNLVLADDLRIYSGTFDANDHNVTSTNYVIQANGDDITVNMGSGTWLATASSGFVVSESGYTATINCETSTIKFTYAGANDTAFTGLGKTYYNLWHNGISNLLISGSNTFNDFKVDHGGAKSVLFSTGTTTTVNSFTVNGTVTNILTLNKSGIAGQFTLSKSSGTVNCDYLNISNSNASGGATWIANNSVDTANNDGLLFYVNTILTPIDAGTTTLLAPTVIGDANSNLTLINAGSVVTLIPTVTGDAGVTLSAIALSITIPEVSVTGDANATLSSILALTTVFIEPTISVERNWEEVTTNQSNWTNVSDNSTTWNDSSNIETNWSDV